MNSQFRTVLVLGANSDIARATLRRLTTEGVRRVVIAVRNVETVADLERELHDQGITCTTVSFDATDVASHQGLVASITREVGTIDLAIVSFGVLGDQRSCSETPVLASGIIDVNFTGAITMLLSLVHVMKSQQCGTIAVLSSVAGIRVRDDNAVYGATKAGLDAFCDGLRQQRDLHNVRIVTIRPGFVHTSMTRNVRPRPFAITPERVARDVVRGLKNSSEVIWSPGYLRWMFLAIRLAPRKLFREVSYLCTRDSKKSS